MNKNFRRSLGRIVMPIPSLLCLLHRPGRAALLRVCTRCVWGHRQGCIKNITWDGVDADGYCLSVWIDAPSRADACAYLIEFPGVRVTTV